MKTQGQRTMKGGSRAVREFAAGLLVGIVVSTTSAASAGTAADPWMIVPGKSVGVLHVGIRIKAVVDAWGPPDKVEYRDPSKLLRLVGVYEYDSFKIGITVTCGIVDWIRTSNPQYKTAEGIRVGHPIEKAIAIYGKGYVLSASSDGGGGIVYIDIGISFDTSSRRIKAISVFNRDLTLKLVDKSAFDPSGCDRSFGL